MHVLRVTSSISQTHPHKSVKSVNPRYMVSELNGIVGQAPPHTHTMRTQRIFPRPCSQFVARQDSRLEAGCRAPSWPQGHSNSLEPHRKARDSKTVLLCCSAESNWERLEKPMCLC